MLQLHALCCQHWLLCSDSPTHIGALPLFDMKPQASSSREE